MRGNLAGPRILLRRLRETMAKPTDAQERLNEIVRLIAANMVAEVCSVYVLRSDNLLELYATEGLNPLAVHETRLQVGEGLVGHIASEARILNLSEPQEHPAFAYRPETARKSTMPFWVCRSFGLVGRWAFWLSRTRRNVSIPMRKSRRCKPLQWCWPS